MPSLNFDFLFNGFYVFLLAIRYVVVFWILGINKKQYLIDHIDDKIDGFRDKGWISFQNDSQIIDLSNPNQSSIQNDISYHIDSVSNQSFFYNIKWSIQNPILNFMADVLVVFALFVFSIFMYVFCIYLLKNIPFFKKIKENSEKSQKEYEELKVKAEEILSQKKNINLEQENLEKKYQEEINQKKIEIENLEQIKKDIEEDFPAGITGLPIDFQDLEMEDKNILEEEISLLKKYKMKNNISKENEILKVAKNQNLENQISKNQIAEAKEIEINLDIKNDWKKRWQIILSYLEGKEETLWRIGIIEADNLLDNVLTEKGYFGETLSEKLKQAKFPNIDLAWNAHKVRNQIAHDGLKFILSERNAKQTLKYFEKTFQNLKVFE